jgi:hypothetical protein
MKEVPFPARLHADNNPLAMLRPYGKTYWRFTVIDPHTMQAPMLSINTMALICSILKENGKKRLIRLVNIDSGNPVAEGINHEDKRRWRFRQK